MPHDRKGNLLKVGDVVNIPCVVKNIYSGEEYCNVCVETQEPLHPGDKRNEYSLNAKQVELNN